MEGGREGGREGRTYILGKNTKRTHMYVQSVHTCTYM